MITKCRWSTNPLAINLLVKFGVMLFKSTDSLLDRQREKDRGAKAARQ